MIKAGILLFFSFAFLMTDSSQAQVFTGGSVGVHYSRGYYIEASPIIGYRMGIVDVGISPFFSYREYRDRDNRYSYGNRIFTQVSPVPQVFGHAEFEMTNIEHGGERKWITGLPVGAGYRYGLGSRSEAYGMVLYDLLLDDDSPVENPIVRGGVIYRF